MQGRTGFRKHKGEPVLDNVGERNIDGQRGIESRQIRHKDSEKEKNKERFRDTETKQQR